MKKVRDGAWHPVDAVLCTDRVGDEKIELRAQDWARLIVYTKKQYSFISFFMKKARDGAWHPVAAILCTDRVGDEKIELRAQDWARFMQKGISFRISLCMKKARDGDRTRDPLLGKEVLHR